MIKNVLFAIKLGCLFGGIFVAEGACEDRSPLLFISFGESNSGGYAENMDATLVELQPRMELQFWNVRTTLFEPLEVGVNNNLDHFRLEPKTHGWELGLANQVEAGKFGLRLIYFVQTGQGGSVVSQWSVDGLYWPKFLDRTRKAREAIKPDPDIVVWVTLGINDAIAGTPPKYYESAMIEILQRLQSELPRATICIAKLPPLNENYNEYSRRVDSISQQLENVTAVEVNGLDMRDDNHWSYEGMKALSTRMIEATIANNQKDTR